MNFYKYLCTAWCLILISQFGLTWATTVPVKDNFTYTEQCREPDDPESLPVDIIQRDNECRYTMSGFQIDGPDTSRLIALRQITGSDILNLFTHDKFKERKCNDFHRVEYCAVSYIRIRERCMDISEILVKLGIGLYRAMCSPVFEDTLKSALDTVGDDCINDMYQKLFNADAIPIDKEDCQQTLLKAAEDVVSNGKRFAYLKSNFGTSIINNCFLHPVRQVCGEAGQAQMKRLTDLLVSGLNF